MIIFELFDSKVPYKWVDKEDEYWVANFEIEGKDYIVSFTKDDHNVWYVVFSLFSINARFADDQFGNTGTGNQFEVYSTVMKIIEEFIREVNPETFSFTGNKKLGKDNLYRKMIKYMESRFRKLGYDVPSEEDDYHGTKTLFTFQKQKQEAVNELFDSKTDYEWEIDNSIMKMASFIINDNNVRKKYCVACIKGNAIWNITFRLDNIDGKELENNDMFGNTGTGNQFEVYSTVLKIIEDFIKEVHPYGFKFSGDISLGKDTLYRKMIKYMSTKLKSLGYGLSNEKEDEGAKEFIFKRLDQTNEETINELSDEEQAHIMRSSWIPSELIEWLDDHYLNLIGKGIYSEVYGKRGSNKIVKVNLEMDRAYKRFIHFARDNPSPYFPKVYDIKEMDHKGLFLFITEKLEPCNIPFIEEHMHKYFNFIAYLNSLGSLALGYLGIEREFNSYASTLANANGNNEEELKKNAADKFLNSPTGLLIDKALSFGGYDIHIDNIMIRPGTTQLVLADPVSSLGAHNEISRNI